MGRYRKIYDDPRRYVLARSSTLVELNLTREVIATACPFCSATLQEARPHWGTGSQPPPLDIAQIVAGQFTSDVVRIWLPML